MSDIVKGSGDIELVTASDTVGFGRETRGISFSGTGAVSVVCSDSGKTVVIPSGALLPGGLYPLRVTRVNSTGTTATGIVAYF